MSAPAGHAAPPVQLSDAVVDELDPVKVVLATFPHQAHQQVALVDVHSYIDLADNYCPAPPSEPRMFSTMAPNVELRQCSKCRAQPLPMFALGVHYAQRHCGRSDIPRMAMHPSLELCLFRQEQLSLGHVPVSGPWPTEAAQSPAPTGENPKQVQVQVQAQTSSSNASATATPDASTEQK